MVWKHSQSDDQNFREFEELIDSGAKEITLTEDIILEQSIEINTNGRVIDGNSHVIDENNNSLGV